MAGDSSSAEARELDQTPTWAVASVAAAIIIISLILEKSLYKLGNWFTERKKRALYEALENIKGELMVLGFISLVLTFAQVYIAKICIPSSIADSMLPCSLEKDSTRKDTSEKHRRRLLWNDHRLLAAKLENGQCKDGYEPIITIEGFHQLHMFISFLAVFHVIYSVLTMTLGKLKIRRWKSWEMETTSIDYAFASDSSRFRLTHETSFVRLHDSCWNRIPLVFYVVCFFRQFFISVRKADYLALRNGFITVHLAPGSKFDFQKYIKRSLEDDFKVVVGVSPLLWATVVLFLLLNVHGWQALFWASLTPLVIILAVGTKLQAIIAQMALEITQRNTIVQGIPLVQVSDKHFWFNRPRLVLSLIHFTLFQNAFQITYFLWIWYEFGLHSCFNENFRVITIRVALGIGVQFLCSYITLPLYALVTQMGTTMKKSIFDEQTSKALENWRKIAVKKNKGAKIGRTPMTSLGASPGTTHSVANRDDDALESQTGDSNQHNHGHAIFPSKKPAALGRP